MDFRCGCPVQGHLAACRATWYTVGSLARIRTHAHVLTHIWVDTEGDRERSRAACDSYADYWDIRVHLSLTDVETDTPAHWTRRAGLLPFLALRLPQVPVSQCALALPPSPAAVIATQDGAPSRLFVQPTLQAPNVGRGGQTGFWLQDWRRRQCFSVDASGLSEP